MLRWLRTWPFFSSLFANVWMKWILVWFGLVFFTKYDFQIQIFVPVFQINNDGGEIHIDARKETKSNSTKKNRFISIKIIIKFPFFSATIFIIIIIIYTICLLLLFFRLSLNVFFSFHFVPFETVTIFSHSHSLVYGGQTTILPDNNDDNDVVVVIIIMIIVPSSKFEVTVSNTK